jgi:ubiquinone/menaquinone biosynthesis C-methylase UbiE
MYENESLSRATGGVLHPGGVGLTRRLLENCTLREGDRVLELGCGKGDTIFHLAEQLPIRAMGIDASLQLLQSPHAPGNPPPLTCALGTSLPIAQNQVDLILAECSLSAIGAFDLVLADAWRVLRPGGALAFHDVYVRNPAGTEALQSLPLTSGLRNAISQAEIRQKLQEQGFEVIKMEDCSKVLVELTWQLVFTHGSMESFWSQSEPDVDPRIISAAIKQAKPGYILVIARKE